MLQRPAAAQFRFGGHVARDEDGHLFDRRTREQLTLGQLAHALDLSPRTITSLVDLPERDALVTRTPHARDRRATWIRLTSTGRELVDRVWEELIGRHNPLVAGFTDEEVAQLRHLCYKLLLNLATRD